MYMLQALDIYKKFGHLEVLKGVSLQVKQGEVIAIIGPSGSGKSTLLRCLNRLETIDRGTIEIDGEIMAKNGPDGRAVYSSEKDITRLRRKMGMVFQNFNLFPHKSVLENLMLAPMLVNNVTAEEAEKTARELLAKVGLSQKADNYPFELSGGQQQRVAIARALAAGSYVILADEPTGNLDSGNSRMIVETLQRLAHQEKRCVIVVTHDPAVAAAADVQLRMQDGRLTQEEQQAEA